MGHGDVVFPTEGESVPSRAVLLKMDGLLCAEQLNRPQN